MKQRILDLWLVSSEGSTVQYVLLVVVHTVSESFAV